MFILNQIVGIGDFDIMDNFRLIVIAAIFIGIIVVLLYLKAKKGGRKKERRHPQSTNPYDSGSKEQRYANDAVDDFMRIEEEIKARKDEESDDIIEPEVEIEEVPDINLEEALADIETIEGESDVKQKVDVKNTTADFTTIIEGLISKIEEREREVINKVENVVDTRIQEVLSKINGRIDEVLLVQKKSSVLILEKMINSLRQKEETLLNKIQESIESREATSETLDTLLPQETETLIEKTVMKRAPAKKKTVPKEKKAAKGKTSVKKKQVVKKEPIAKKTSASRKKPKAVADKSISLEMLDILPIEEESVDINPSEKSKQPKEVVDKKIEFEEITETDLGAPSENSDILGKLASSLQMGGSSVGISSPDESGDTEVKKEVLTKKIEEDDWEILSEVKEGDIKAVEDEPIISPEKIEKDNSEEMAGELDDLDIMDFLKEDSMDSTLPDESNANEEIAELSEKTKKASSGVKEAAKEEEEEVLPSSEVMDKNALEVDEADSADFDIQEFLEELGNLPSEKDPDAEK